MGGSSFKSPFDIAKDIVKSTTGISLSSKQFNILKSVEKTVGKTFSQMSSVMQKLVVAPIMDVTEDTLVAVLPDHIAMKLTSVTGVVANAAVGKINLKDINEAVKDAMKLAVLPATMAYQVDKELIKMGDGLTGGMISDLDVASGGLLTSVQNLQSINESLYEGEGVDLKARAIDAIKVAMAVSSGGTAVAISTAVNYAGAKTGLDQTPQGRMALQAAAAYLTAQAAEKAAAEAAEKKAAEQAAKQGTTSAAGSTISNTATKTATGKVVKDTARQVVVQQTTKKAVGIGVNEVIKDKELASIVTSVASTAVINQSGMSNTKQDIVNKDLIQTTAKIGVSRVIADKDLQNLASGIIAQYSTEGDKKSLYDIAKEQSLSSGKSVADRELEKKTGLSIKEAVILYDIGKDPYAAYDQYKLEMETKIEAEKAKMMKRVEELKEIAKTAENFDLNKEVNQLQSEFYKNVDSEMEEMNRKMNDFQTVINKAQTDYDAFEYQKFLEREAELLKKKGLLYKDQFIAESMDKLYDQAKKYGMDFLKYLMWKYGPRPDYDSVITQEDISSWQTVEVPQDRLYNINHGSNFMPLLVIGGGIATFFAVS